MTTISIKIKHGTDQIEVIETNLNATVKELKEKLTQKFNTEPSQIIDVLQNLNLKADSTMHLVVTTQQAQQPPQQYAPAPQYKQPQQPVGGQQSGLPGFGGLEGAAGMGGFGRVGDQPNLPNPNTAQVPPPVQDKANQNAQNPLGGFDQQSLMSLMGTTIELNQLLRRKRYNNIIKYSIRKYLSFLKAI